MASYTSVQSGDWDEAATWGSGGGHPGDGADGDGDTFTIAAGHVVTVGMDGTVATLGSGTVAGTLQFAETGGRHRLRLAGSSTLTIGAGGTLRMDGTAPGSRQSLELHSSSDGSCRLTVGNGATAYLAGRPKTATTCTASAVAGGATALEVVEHGGWEPGDTVALVAHRASAETVVLAADCGDGVWALADALSGGYPAGCEVWNLTRSVSIVGSSVEHDGTMELMPGAFAPQCTCVEFGHLDEVRFLCPATVVGCVARDMESSECGLTNGYGDNIYDGCVAYSAESAWAFYQAGSDARYIGCAAYCGGAGGVGFRMASGGARLERCRAVAQYGLYSDYSLLCSDTHLWGCRYAVYLLRQGQFTDCVLGWDPGGNPAPNDFDLYAVRGPLLLDRCHLADTGSPGALTALAVVRSLNHNGIGGLCREWQQRGSCESDSAHARGGTGYCDMVDPSSPTLPYLYYVSFPCAPGKTPTLRFYARGTEGLGPLAVGLGRHRCGLSGVRRGWGSLDEQGQFAVGADYSQVTVGLAGTSDCAGQVEVCIEVYDSAGGLIYLDDFSVTGND